MADFLLELLSEEIPARMQARAIEQLQEKFVLACQSAGLSYERITPYVTPRRLALHVKGLPEKQPNTLIERKGPKTNAPEAAIEGFCKSTGIAREKLEIRLVGKDELYFAVTEQKGQLTSLTLKPLIEQIIQEFHWPKSMRSGDYAESWVRPLRSILCLLESEVIPVRYGHIVASNQTLGHRFMSEWTITITHPQEYEPALEKAFVIADAGRRRELIREKAAEAAASQSLLVKEDEGLLEEVTGLVEYPVPLLGRFDEHYLRLPPEVLVLEMRYHQKYFAALNTTRGISHYFIAVANIAAKDGGEKIVSGNQRVLKARLEDGAFYWEQDRKKPLSQWANGLESMIFHKKLGTVADKVARIRKLAEYLAVFIPHANIHKVTKAAELCKADLTTGMVGEFPELQGVMGRYYALEQQEDKEVADAIRDHYKPAGAQDELPEGAVAIAVALADRLDSLLALFAAKEIPTGSKDPFGSRRAALGVLRIIRGYQLRMPLSYLVDKAAEPFMTHLPNGEKIEDIQEVKQQVLSFLKERLQVILKEEGITHDVVDAVIHQDKEMDIARISTKAASLQHFLNSETGASIAAAYKRASNILRKEEQKDAATYRGDYDGALLQLPEEQELAKSLKSVDTEVKHQLREEKFTLALEALLPVEPTIHQFFDKVIVNAEQPVLRVNRLALLAALRETMQDIADFSKIEG